MLTLTQWAARHGVSAEALGLAERVMESIKR